MPLFGAEGIGIDVGTMQTSIFLDSENGVALREPTSVLVNAENMQEVLAVGLPRSCSPQTHPKTGATHRLMCDATHGQPV